MLGLYLASPLDRNTYLLAKAASVGLVLTLVTTGPLLLMMAAYAIIGEGPGGPLDYLVLLIRILLAGLSISALYTGLSLAVSSFTARRAAASATIILMLMTSAIVVGTLTEPDGAGWSPNLFVFDFITLPVALVFHIFGEGDQLDPPVSDVAFSVLLLASLVWIVAFALITRYCYRKIEVTR
jgi:hypothetical protein